MAAKRFPVSCIQHLLCKQSFLRHLEPKPRKFKKKKKKNGKEDSDDSQSSQCFYASLELRRKKKNKTGISTCPLTHMKFLAGSILQTHTFLTVRCFPPIRPGIFLPLKTYLSTEESNEFHFLSCIIQLSWCYNLKIQELRAQKTNSILQRIEEYSLRLKVKHPRD